MNGDTIEHLAETIHELFVETTRRQGTFDQHPLARLAWHELSDDVRQRSRRQAADVPLKLFRLGYQMVPADTPGVVPLVIGPDMLETLAAREHEGWMQDLREAGWTHGPIRDNDARIHPMLIPYDDLPEEQKEFDREPVRALPELLAAAGLAVVPLRA